MITLRGLRNVLGSVSVSVLALGWHAGTSVAQMCANEPSRTIFAGGPNTEACRQFDNNQDGCESAFHLSGAGHLAPCYYEGGGCYGNTANYDPTVAQSCEPLPSPSCIDPSRTLQLTGGTSGGDGSEICESLKDQATCETAWHTGAKGIGISCCWDGSGCEGSIWGFFNGDCTQRNTCVASSTSTSAPALGSLGMLAVGLILLRLGVKALQTRRPPRLT